MDTPEKRRAAFSRRADHIIRLQHALSLLAKNEDRPVDVIGDGSCLFDDDAINADLEKAIGWLLAFGHEWKSRGRTSGPRSATARATESCERQAREMGAEVVDTFSELQSGAGRLTTIAAEAIAHRYDALPMDVVSIADWLGRGTPLPEHTSRNLMGYTGARKVRLFDAIADVVGTAGQYSGSFPFLEISKRLDIPHGHVMAYAEYISTGNMGFMNIHGTTSYFNQLLPAQRNELTNAVAVAVMIESRRRLAQDELRRR